MKIIHKRYFVISIVIALITLILDQLSKYWLLEHVGFAAQPYMQIEITSFFNLVLVWNHGISFGMLSGAKIPLALIIMSLVIVGFLLNWLRKADDKMTITGIGLVVGGAFGNIIDRIRFGAVADFFDVHALNYHWPAFNIADSTIFIGVVILCIHAMMHPQK
jgi:signal peptidase II